MKQNPEQEQPQDIDDAIATLNEQDPTYGERHIENHTVTTDEDTPTPPPTEE